MIQLLVALPLILFAMKLRQDNWLEAKGMLKKLKIK
jgi:hypothetical protein